MVEKDRSYIPPERQMPPGGARGLVNYLAHEFELSDWWELCCQTPITTYFDLARRASGRPEANFYNRVRGEVLRGKLSYDRFRSLRDRLEDERELTKPLQPNERTP
jgi:hypothetical protein